MRRRAGDIILGTDADPAIVAGLTAATIEKIESVSPGASKLIAFKARIAQG